MARFVPAVLGPWVIAAAAAPAATVLYCPFEALEGWSVRTVGAGRVRLVQRASGDRAVELTARRGTALLTRALPLEAVRGRRLTVRCLMRAERLVRGPQATSLPKLHLAVLTPNGLTHFAARLDANSDWHTEGFTADIPPDARRVVLNLGLECCTGTAGFDRLVVRNDLTAAVPLDLAPVANAGHDQLGLGAFPKGTVRWEGIPFRILDAAAHDGRDCLRLRGTGHEDWPPSTCAPIRVGRVVSKVHILHAVLGAGGKSPSPSVLWTARFAGGQTAGLSVFEGRQVGAVSAGADLPQWKLAWRGQAKDGTSVAFGVTTWTLYGDDPLESLTCAAYQGSPAVILAVTVVEEPPAEPAGPQEGESFDEMGELP